MTAPEPSSSVSEGIGCASAEAAETSEAVLLQTMTIPNSSAWKAAWPRCGVWVGNIMERERKGRASAGNYAPVWGRYAGLQISVDVTRRNELAGMGAAGVWDSAAGGVTMGLEKRRHDLDNG
jgi:hypothetical protein